MESLIERFLSQLWSEAGLADNTIAAYRADLVTFACYCAQKGLVLRQLAPSDIQQFMISLREKDELAVSSVKLSIAIY